MREDKYPESHFEKGIWKQTSVREASLLKYTYKHFSNGVNL